MTDMSGPATVAYPYDLPPKLARRLAQGEIGQADAELALEQGASVIVAARRHVPDPPDVPWALNLLHHLLAQWLHKIDGDREVVAQRINRRTWQMAERRPPVSSIYAEAHDINGAADFPLSEREVKAIVDGVLAQIMRGGQSRGR
jgi:NAD(P)-dependent dehydrogenase (short-subunit alcohol dehydrogenase family)